MMKRLVVITSILVVCFALVCIVSINNTAFITDLRPTDVESIYATDYWQESYANEVSTNDAETILVLLSKIEIDNNPQFDLKLQGGTNAMFKIVLKNGKTIDFAANGTYIIVNRKEYYKAYNDDILREISDIYYDKYDGIA